jgi:DNA-binding NtrC family response regulator
LVRSVKTGAFREDLYFRISPFSFEVPPLRERRSDLANLLHVFMEKGSELSRAQFEQWLSYAWPGNVRELQSTCDRWTHAREDAIQIYLDKENTPAGRKRVVPIEAVAMPLKSTLSSGESVSVDPVDEPQTVDAEEVVVDLPYHLMELSRGKLATEFLKNDMDKSKLARAFDTDTVSIDLLFAHCQLTVTDLLLRNLRKNTALKLELLQEMGTQVAVAKLLGRSSVYLWYKDIV